MHILKKIRCMSSCNMSIILMRKFNFVFFFLHFATQMKGLSHLWKVRRWTERAEGTGYLFDELPNFWARDQRNSPRNSLKIALMLLLCSTTQTVSFRKSSSNTWLRLKFAIVEENLRCRDVEGLFKSLIEAYFKADH